MPLIRIDVVELYSRRKYFAALRSAFFALNEDARTVKRTKKALRRCVVRTNVEDVDGNVQGSDRLECAAKSSIDSNKLLLDIGDSRLYLE